jgi:4'-phosphopantetheinyl transferase EntD
MRAQAYIEHIRQIESCEGISPQARLQLVDSAKRQLFKALSPQEQRTVFAYQLLRQGHPRDTIPGRITAAFDVRRSQAYRDLAAAYELVPKNGTAIADDGNQAGTSR